ncbi:MAG TPA: hypothetical protein VGM05_02170, partial [Planctomycetaceae bacterium]
MLSRRKLAARSLVVLSFSALCVWSVAGETRSGSAGLTSSLIRFDVPGGETLFALSLKAGAAEPVGARDVAIVVDTSASQAGDHRLQSMA